MCIAHPCGGASLDLGIFRRDGSYNGPAINPLRSRSSARLLLALGTLVIYHNHPLSMDEYAAYFQSRVFAAGRLHGRFPVELLDWLIPRGFQDYFLNVSRATGSVAEAYWPGFALLLTPFMWAGVPWLCNPVISALTLLVIHRLALELFDNREAAGFATAADDRLARNLRQWDLLLLHAGSPAGQLCVRPTSGPSDAAARRRSGCRRFTCARTA